jgi:dinuclear metal center YbgI/SA1388 family protein
MTEVHDLIRYCDDAPRRGALCRLCAEWLAGRGRASLIQRLVSGVTASAALIEAAIAEQADAILVHHGWFWKNENPCLTGIKGRRARTLLRAGASLIAYHLPLDAHPELGNNATLGRVGSISSTAEPNALANGLVWVGRLAEPMTPAAFAEHVSQRLARPAQRVGRETGVIERVAWCTGGGQGYLEQAAGLGVDAFLSGELSEQTTHQARELDLCYLAAGHHATERYGIQALGEHLAERFGLWHRFVEIDNPA